MISFDEYQLSATRSNNLLRDLKWNIIKKSKFQIYFGLYILLHEDFNLNNKTEILGNLNQNKFLLRPVINGWLGTKYLSPFLTIGDTHQLKVIKKLSPIVLILILLEKVLFIHLFALGFFPNLPLAILAIIVLAAQNIIFIYYSSIRHDRVINELINKLQNLP